MSNKFEQKHTLYLKSITGMKAIILGEGSTRKGVRVGREQAGSRAPIYHIQQIALTSYVT